MSRIRPRILALLVFVGLLGSAAVLPAQAQLGVAGGLNFESIDDVEAGSGSATLDNSTGYHVGLVYDLSVGPVGIRPGVYYRRVGTFDLSKVSNQLVDAKYTVTAWEIPVDLRYTFLPTPIISPYLSAGPKATLPRGEGDFDDALTDIAYSLNVGVGADISLPGLSWTLQPELRYTFGASGLFAEDKEVTLGSNNVTFTPSDSPRLSSIALRLHLLF